MLLGVRRATTATATQQESGRKRPLGPWPSGTASPSEAHIVIELYQNDRRRWPHLRSPSLAVIADEAQLQQESRTNNRRQRSAVGVDGQTLAWYADQQPGRSRAVAGKAGQAGEAAECRLPCAGCKLANRERAQTQRRRCADAAPASSSSSCGNDADDCGPLIGAAPAATASCTR